MSRARRAAGLVALGVMIFLIMTPSRAAAHAELMRADPAIDGVVANAPTQVQLWFSEQPELRFSEVRVVDQAGRSVDRGDLRADPADPLSLVIGLNSLSPGSYTVSWKALSAVDGHVTRGVFVFTVGLDQTPTGPVISGQDSGTTATPDKVAVRLLNYVGLALLLGFFPFVLWVLMLGLRIGAATADTAALVYRRAWRLGMIGAGCALLGALGSLISQTATAVGVSFVQAIGPDLGSVAFGTRFALLWWSRVVLLLGLIGVLLLARRAPGSKVLGRIALVLGLAEVLAWSLGSHAAAIPDISPAAVGTDWGHIVAMVVWTGGLGYLALTAWTLARETQPREAVRLAASLVPRFSVLAASCVAVLLFTGIYQLWLHVGGIRALVATPYGQALLVKLLLLLPLLAVAAFNLRVLSPRLQAARQREPQQHSELVRRLRHTVAAEIVLVLGMLAAVGVMTNLMPARQALLAQGIDAKMAAEDLRISLNVQPGNAALNRFDIFVTDRSGRPVTDAERVALRFDMLEMDMGESELVAKSQGNGHYTTQGGNLAMPGSWQIVALVRRTGRDDVRATVTMPIAPAPPPNVSSATPPPGEPNVVLGVELVIAGIAALVVALRTTTRRRRVLRWAAPFAAFAVIAGAGLTAQGARAIALNTVTNPIPPTAASIDRGQDIYAQNCASCHGITGRGDGPAGLSLVPRPADFRVHLAAGHTDAQLFDWITNGFPGTAMPAWRDTLSEEDRWNVLNYIKSAFGPSGSGPNPSIPTGR